LCVGLFPSHLLKQSIDFNESWYNIMQLENTPTPYFSPLVIKKNVGDVRNY